MSFKNIFLSFFLVLITSNVIAQKTIPNVAMQLILQLR